MFFTPGTLRDITQKFTREATERVASNWWRLLVNSLLLIVAGVLIFSIDWSVVSLATAATNGTGSRGVHAGNGQPAPAAH